MTTLLDRAQPTDTTDTTDTTGATTQAGQADRTSRSSGATRLSVTARVDELVACATALVADLDGDVLDADLARRLVDRLGRVERIVAAGVAIAAKRVADSNVWCTEGDRSAAHSVARHTGVAVGAAQASLDTATKLHALSAADAAVRAGELSAAQAKEIAGAASADPTQEKRLIEAASETGLHGLRSECARVKAAAEPDPDAKRQAIHRTRRFSHWTDADGAFAFSGRTTVEQGARLLAAMRPHHDRLFREAREQGRRELPQAYALDALVALAETSPSAPPTGGNSPRARVHVRIDHAALVRGRADASETCEIAGVGPVPVSTVKSMMSDAFLAAIVTDGIDIHTVAHLGRTIPAHLRTALVERDPTCVVPGCTTSDHLEIDHVIPFADGGPTRLDNLARLCRHHHDQKTYEGRRLQGPPGQWTFTPPRHERGHRRYSRPRPEPRHLQFDPTRHEPSDVQFTPPQRAPGQAPPRIEADPPPARTGPPSSGRDRTRRPGTRSRSNE